VFVLSLPFIVAMRALGVESAVGLLAVALIFLILGVVRGQLRTPWGMPLQTAGMFAWGVIGLTVLFVSPNLGAYLVAAGLIGHAAWDIVHYWANRIAARSYAEFCAVFDILVGVTILFML
jgi:Na+/H+ antiporter NhaA